MVAYTTRYGAEFAKPTRVGAYDATIYDNSTAAVRARTEAAHKAKRANRVTYETAGQETAQFILAVVKDTWVRELQATEMFYTGVAAKALLTHLQAGCTGRHNLMQQYHLEIEGIPEYINMLKGAQKQAGRAGRKIANKTLLLFAITEMLITEQSPRTNNEWEDRDKDQKTWADWKTSSKRSHNKARVKAQAAEGSDKFGAANAAGRVFKNSKVATENGHNEVGMMALEGYFDNLCVAATNKKSVLEKLVAKNAKLAATNEDLVAIVKKLSNENKDLQQETYRLKKTGGSRAPKRKRDPTLCPHFKK